jgi:hypothetical protein
MVIAADVVTGAVHDAFCPKRVGESASDCQSVRVYVKCVPRLSVMVGAAIPPVSSSHAHCTRRSELAGGVKLTVVTVATVPVA